MEKFLEILRLAAQIGAGVALPGVGGAIVTTGLGVLSQLKDQFDLEAVHAGMTTDELADQMAAELRKQLPQTAQNIRDRMAETRGEKP
jgi:hypothetical protein